MSDRPLRAVIGLALVSACAVTPSAEPDSTPDYRPQTAAPAGMVEPLGPILVLRQPSGPFLTHGERTILGYPEVVVFDDGRVVAGADVDWLQGRKPAYRSLVLSAEEFGGFVDELRAAELPDLVAGTIPEAAFCVDCTTTIIRTDVDGETAEIVAYGLVTDGPESSVSRLPYPDDLVELDQRLNALAERTLAEGEPFDEPLPRTPISPAAGGG